MSHAGRRVLIAGGAGFIGSHLCERFIAEGDFVYAVDNYSTGRKSNLDLILEQDKLQCLDHDVQKPLHLDVDLIINLASPASPPQYQKDAINTIKTNFLGTMHLLDLAQKLTVPFVQASTSEVYGDPQVNPQPESYWGHVNCIGPRACYDESKRIAETLCIEYRKERRVDTRLVRIFNTYGPRMNAEDGRVVSNLVVAALKDEPMSIYGSGEQTRSFCFISDLVHGLYQIATDKNLRNVGPVNLGNDHEFTINELAALIFTLLAKKPHYSYLPLPENDPQVRKPDLTLARKLFNWQPKVDLEQGLLHTIEYFAKSLS